MQGHVFVSKKKKPPQKPPKQKKKKPNQNPEPCSVASAREWCVSDRGLGASRDELPSAELWQKGLHPWLYSEGSNKYSWKP